MGNLSSKQIPLQTYLYRSLNISRQLDLSEATVSRAGDEDYQVTGWRMEADMEETRPVREVRIGLIQNKIVLSTDAPINQQVSIVDEHFCFNVYHEVTALHRRIGGIIENAAKSGVNIICLQEAWSELQQ